MKLKQVLATSTAITLAFAGYALADDSVTIVHQDGNNNGAQISQEVGNGHRTFLTQMQNNNFAIISQKNNGTNPGDSNRLGSANDAALQNGENNYLNLIQNYNGNNGNQVGTSGWGFEQLGNGNVASITQLGARNIAGEIWQNATGSASNVLDLNQGTNGEYAFNRVNSIRQLNNHLSEDNVADIRQSGGPSNLIDAFVQNGGGNYAKITQTGERNALSLVSQIGTSNVAEISLRGNYNGSSDVHNGQTAHNSAVLVPFSGPILAATSLTQGQILQDGENNYLSVNVIGDENLMAFHQIGSDNGIQGLVTGNLNQVAVLQNGHANWLEFSQTTNGNAIAAGQIGNNNYAKITQ